MAQGHFSCPICKSQNLTLRYEARYVYSYVIDNDAPGLKNSDEFLSYLYDKREQKDNRTFIECNHCGTQYPSSFLDDVLQNGNSATKDSII